MADPNWFDRLWDCLAQALQPHHNLVVTVVSFLCLGGLIYTARKLKTCGKPKEHQWAARFLVIWTMFPPLWFWVEYHLFVKENPVFQDEKTLDRFIHSQECSRNIWLGLVGLLIAMYLTHPPVPATDASVSPPPPPVV
jgi:hypothetical protein